MGGRSGKTRERHQSHPSRVEAGKKAAKTRRINENKKQKKKAKNRGKRKQFTLGISQMAWSNLAAKARRTSTSADEVIEKLILNDRLSVKFKRGQKTTFRISTEAHRKLGETAAHYQVSLEAVIERYLRNLS